MVSPALCAARFGPQRSAMFRRGHFIAAAARHFPHLRPFPWKLNASITPRICVTTWLTVLLSLGGIFDVDRKERRLEEVNREIENPNLWDDPKHAQEVNKEQKLLEDLVGSFKRLTAGVNDARELFAMALEEGDEAGAESIALEVEGYARDVIRSVQDARKAADLDIADRISLVLTVPADDVAKVEQFRDLIAHETLATSFEGRRRAERRGC